MDRPVRNNLAEMQLAASRPPGKRTNVLDSLLTERGRSGIRQDVGNWFDETLRRYGGPHLHAALMGSEAGELGSGQPARGGVLSGIAEMSPGADMRDLLEGSGQIMRGEPLEGAGLMGGALLGTMVPGSVGGYRRAAEEATEGIRAYHGSPHDFDRFSMDRIGTGEGAQAYGHGLYFAENEAVAKQYRDDLTSMRVGKAQRALERANGDIDQAIADVRSKIDNLRGLPNAGNGPARQARFVQYNEETLAELAALKRGGGMSKGSMYEVAIKADPESFLDWDKPLSQQSAAVRDAINRVARDPRFALERVTDDMRPVSYKELLNNPEAAQELRRLGVSGIRYLDQGSRTVGEGSRNFVVFDDATIEILRKYGLLAPVAGGAAALSMGQPSQAQAQAQERTGR